MTKRLLLQLLREFWIQMAVSLAWATYRASVVSDERVSIFVVNFSASFFFTSWMIGQIIRIKKQQKVEDEFQNVKSELVKLLDTIREQNRYLIGHTTGGDSLGYFTPTNYV